MGLWLGEVEEEVVAGLAKEREGEGEALRASVVGVGDVVVGSIRVEEFGDAVDTFGGFEGRCLLTEGVDVGVVHADNQVEAFVVVIADGTGGMDETVAMGIGHLTHAAVGLFALMVTQNARRVHLKPVLRTVAFHHVTEDTFRHRRTTDITQADKKDRVFAGVVHFLKHFFVLQR